MIDSNACPHCQITMKIFAWYAFMLIICGTSGNLYASHVCFKLNKVSTFKILSVLFIFETISLYTVRYLNLIFLPSHSHFINISISVQWNLNIFIKNFMPYKGANQTLSEFNVIESLNLVTCKIFTFAQFYSLQCISWLLTYISIDQAIKLYSPSRAFNKKAKNVYKMCLVNRFF